jgi:hypothetical protein
MIFDVLKSKRHFANRDNGKSSMSLSFEVVPTDRDYLDIGDSYILCAAGYLPICGKERQPVVATVHVQSDPTLLDHIKGARPICGHADFFAEREDSFDFRPAALAISIIVEPKLFEEMSRVEIAEPGMATLYVKIEGLDFGWEPEGSHLIWKLDDTSDCELAMRRRITNFWLNVETFRTSESAIRGDAESRMNAELAESPNPEDRKLAANLQGPERPDPVANLLGQIRSALWVIAGLGIVGLVLLNR